MEPTIQSGSSILEGGSLGSDSAKHYSHVSKVSRCFFLEGCRYGCVPCLAPDFSIMRGFLKCQFQTPVSGFWSTQAFIFSFPFLPFSPFSPFPALIIMKFGSQLKEAIYPGWQHAYLDYDGLKKKLQKADKDNPFSERDETEFVEQLDSNLEMVRKKERRSGQTNDRLIETKIELFSYAPCFRFMLSTKKRWMTFVLVRIIGLKQSARQEQQPSQSMNWEEFKKPSTLLPTISTNWLATPESTIQAF